MARFRCNGRKCGRPPKGFVFENDVGQCPKCGALGAPIVHELTDVHFVVMGKGPLMGPYGAHHIACEPEREHLSLDASDGYAATDVPTSVTCPSCMGTPAFQEMVKALFPAYHRELEQQKARMTNVTMGDCGCKK